ncbi:MAG: ATP-dependent protease ATPase subunit HslU [Clostridiales bacterium]|nr:ATP-dependent protease ATPase subunit HslU [Clostridiales bacterium]
MADLVAVGTAKTVDREAELTPSEIVRELDKYIIGQSAAKRAVAIALRNRYRRSLLPEELQGEITPKNILMMGPTGVGKTEIARRLAKLVSAPFIKVEATKFTEVGYVGRDVESIIRDLTEAAIRIVKDEKYKMVEERAKQAANERLVDLLLPEKMRAPKQNSGGTPLASIFGGPLPSAKKVMTAEEEDEYYSTRSSIAFQLNSGLLENQIVEIEVEESQGNNALSAMGIDMNMGDILGSIMPKKKKLRKMSVTDARRVLEAEEADKLIDMDEVTREALLRAENKGIVFIDEIDKIAGRQGASSGPDVSREGVQRDILPIVEGSTVMTKYGPVKTDYMLFIAAGAFHVSKVEDLIPELQGRFPVVVKLDSLTADDFARILVEPDNAITKQYSALLSTENVELNFTHEGVAAIAAYAFNANETSENLGARRLYTIVENLLNDEMYLADGTERTVTVDETYVQQRLKNEYDPQELKKYIL